MVLLTEVSILLVILWICFLWSRRKYYAFAWKMPGPVGLPLVGIVYKLYNVKELLNTLPQLAAEYKTKTLFSWLGPYPTVYTIEPKLTEIVLNSPSCINKPTVLNVFIDLIGVGLFTSNSPIWNARRKLYNPAFSHKMIMKFYPTFNKYSQELCEEFQQVVGCGEVDVKELVFGFALKLTLSTTMGFDMRSSSDSSFPKDFARVLEVAIDIMIKPWLRFPFIFERMQRYKGFTTSLANLKSVVRELALNKIKLSENKEQKESNKTGAVFLDQAIKNYHKNELTSNDVVSDSTSILFGGTESVSTGIFMTLLYLAMHPQYQEEAFNEIVSVFPEKEFDVSYEDLKHLPFLEMCVNESLRHAPIFPIIGRMCTKDIPISNDVVIPKGTQIFIDIYNIHRDAGVWGPNANAFDPDNFLPENVAKRNSYSFIPFSKGPRNCLAWLYAKIILRLALAHILRKYRFTTSFQFTDLHYMQNASQKKVCPYLEVHERENDAKL